MKSWGWGLFSPPYHYDSLSFCPPASEDVQRTLRKVHVNLKRCHSRLVGPGTKIQPKEEILGRISLRTSGQKLQSGPPNPESGEKKNNKHKQLRGIVPEMGGGQIVYVFPFSWGKRETHKQNSQEISGKGRESPGTVPG